MAVVRTSGRDDASAGTSSMYGALFSRLYDVVLARGERAGLRDLRRRVLACAHGEVLEIGAGTGLNLGLYPPDVTALTLAEPEAPMVARLRSRLASTDLGGDVRTSVVTAPGERLPFPDAQFDCVVSTLVLCTVTDQVATLAEVRRVLRPGGALLLLEHVRADDLGLAAWQDRLHGPWKAVGHGCHCNRDTARDLSAAGFDTDTLATAWWHRMPRLVAPLLAGRATLRS